jgi:hypothetical protein
VPAATTSQGIPFMVTNTMKAELRARGISDEQIRNMTPQQAWETLNAPGSLAREPGESPLPAAQPADPAQATLAADAASLAVLPTEGSETAQPPPEADAAPAPGAEVKSQVPPPDRQPDQLTAGIQAPAPPQGAAEIRPEPDETDPAPGTKKGRRQYSFWPEVENYIFGLLVEHGPPSPDDPELPGQKALEELAATFMQQNGWNAAESTIREHVVGMLEYWGKLGR